MPCCEMNHITRKFYTTPGLEGETGRGNESENGREL